MKPFLLFILSLSFACGVYGQQGRKELLSDSGIVFNNDSLHTGWVVKSGLASGHFSRDIAPNGGSWSLKLVTEGKSKLDCIDYYITGIAGKNRFTLSWWDKISNKTSCVRTNSSIRLGILLKTGLLTQRHVTVVPDNDIFWTHHTMICTLTSKITDTITIRLLGGAYYDSLINCTAGGSEFLFDKIGLNTTPYKEKENDKGNAKQNDRQQLALKGIVKSFHKIILSAFDSNGVFNRWRFYEWDNRMSMSPIKREETYQFLFFDSGGMKTLEINDSAHISKDFYKYDRKERMIQSDHYANNKIFTRTFYRYDSLGRHETEYNFNEDTNHPSHIKESINGRSIRNGPPPRPMPSPQQQITQHNYDSSKYDKGGRLIEKTMYRPDGTVIWKRKWTYDKSVQTQEVMNYTRDGNLESDNIICSDTNGNTNYRSYLHLSYRSITQWGVTHDIELQDSSRTIDKFNNNADIIESITTQQHGTNITNKRFEYVYDSIGNWILRIEYVNGSPHERIERKISYY